MCQLLGMNCAQKTDFCFSFSGFRLRGGQCDKHSDGWGLSIYEGRGLRTFIDTLPAAESPLAEMVSKLPIKTLNMMGHIRYATQGHKGDLANVHPFQRELWGVQFCFCHNGDVEKFSSSLDLSEHPMLGMTTEEDRIFNPVGDTDSESLFCAILNALRKEYDSPPTIPELYTTVQKLCGEVMAGEEDTAILNFLLGEFNTWQWHVYVRSVFCTIFVVSHLCATFLSQKGAGNTHYWHTPGQVHAQVLTYGTGCTTQFDNHHSSRRN